MTKKSSTVRTAVSKKPKKSDSIKIEKPSVNSSKGTDTKGRMKAAYKPTLKKNATKKIPQHLSTIEQELAQRNAELAIINSVQEGLARKLDFQEIVDLVGEQIEKIFKADTVSVGMYDAERDWVFNIYYTDRGQIIRLEDGPAPRPSLTAVTVNYASPQAWMIT